MGEKDLSPSAYVAIGHNLKFGSNFCFAVDSFHSLKEKVFAAKDLFNARFVADEARSSLG